jgi:hypothetical protein
MRRSLLIYFLSFLLINLAGQTITGFVSDEETNRKISQAVIYFDGTFHGTITDMHGRFAFDISEYPLMPVTVSSGGYYSVSFNPIPSEKSVQILLKPKLPESDETPGKSEEQKKERKENLKHFKNIILGKTHNALSCEIVNENEIIFKAEKKVLKAYSSSPLIIQNEALGYRATYYLDKFELNKGDGSYYYSGNILFDEDLAKTGARNKQYIKKRGEAYFKSRTYFFRMLWANRLDSAGFVVKNPLDEDLYYENIVIDKGSKGKYLKHFGNEISTYIVFLEEEAVYDAWGKLDISCITEISLENDVFFDEKGYFNPNDITWRGKLAKQQIADLLPLEYYEITTANTQPKAPAWHLKPHSAPSHLSPNSYQRRGISR